MRKLYMIPILAIAFAQGLFAQSVGAVVAINSRLVGASSDQWISNNWNDYDTIALTYTGTRGGSVVNNNIVADSDAEQRWSLSGGALNNSYLYEKTFDANNNLTQYTKRHWTAGSWTNSYRETFSYNGQGQNTMTLSEVGNGNGPTDWEPSIRITKTYDANGNVSTNQRDDWGGSSWGGYQKTTYTYNASNQILTTTVQAYLGGTWQNDSRSTYTYTAGGLTETFLYETWSGGAWLSSQRTNNTYDAQGKITLRIVESNSGGSWVNYVRNTYTYNGQGYLVETIQADGDGAGWIDVNKTTHVRNAQGLSTEQMLYNWVSGTSSWRESNRQIRTYDAAGNRLTEVASHYVGGAWNDGYATTQTFNTYNQLTSRVNEENFGSGLENAFRTYYYYEEYEDGTSGISTIPTLASTVMPNPFTVNVAIQVNAETAGNYTFQVFNMAGQQVHGEERHWATGQQTILLDGQELPKGVYFYKITGESGVASGKLVKQ